MAEIPVLTDEQYQMLLERAVNDPRAPRVGFHRPMTGDPYYRFSRDASGPMLGHHSVGDGVGLLGLQQAVHAVLESRGNYLRSKVVVHAYRDMLAKAPEEWSSETALVLCMLAPLLGVLAELATTEKN